MTDCMACGCTLHERCDHKCEPRYHRKLRKNHKHAYDHMGVSCSEGKPCTFWFICRCGEPEPVAHLLDHGRNLAT